MNFAVWAPLLVPLLAVPAARRLADALPPRAAAWLLAASAVVLAACSTAALGLLTAAGALRLRAVAVFEHLTLPLAGEGSAVVVPVACVAALLLAGCATAVVRTVLRHGAELVRARRAADAWASVGRAGELAVVQDSRPEAFALPGRPGPGRRGLPGRIVVTTGMLRALDPAEREALLAHERAHLTGRHHLFLAAAGLATACHPLLRGLCAPLAYALERWADESAAEAVGDRRLAARAIGRAALAAASESRAAPAGAARPRAALAATAGPVPRRVAALLHEGSPGARRRSYAPRLVAAALAACLAVSAACALEAACDLHGSIEVAQGER